MSDNANSLAYPLVSCKFPQSLNTTFWETLVQILAIFLEMFGTRLGRLPRLLLYDFSLTTSGRRGPSFNYQCPYKKCSKMFSNQSRRNVHILKTHRNSTGETPRDCQICGVKVTNNYEEHKRLYHKSKDCKECNITFSGVNAFLEHQRKVHGDIHTCQVI